LLAAGYFIRGGQKQEGPHQGGPSVELAGVQPSIEPVDRNEVSHRRRRMLHCRRLTFGPYTDSLTTRHWITSFLLVSLTC
ncbi:MAG: hypothetical protein KDK78_10565, partial [Chlamydiia bacterium]|nr:hypothetical protein [Chlamydiia bacterium]